MELQLDRQPSKLAATFGDLYVDGVFECYTLEDQIREPADWRANLKTFADYATAVAKWKIHSQTAIPAGRYRITLEPSQRFGPDTITINAVPGFTSIRMHGGNTAADTEGCVLVGDVVDLGKARISGATFDHVLADLKASIKEAIDAGKEVWITIGNPA